MPPNESMIRLLNPLPAAVNVVSGLPAPTISSLAAVVVAEPLFAVVPVPLPLAVTSRGLLVLSPLYSMTLMLGYAAAWLKRHGHGVAARSDILGVVDR